MKIEPITSPKNHLLNEIRRAVRRGALTGDGLIVAEGVHLLEDALRGPGTVTAVVITPGTVLPTESLHEVRVVEITDQLFQQIAGTDTPQGVITLVRPAAWDLEQVLEGNALVVVLDGLQEPGNAGAILRAAEAFGATGAVFLKGTVSPYNPKAVRASSGSIFRLPCVTGVEPTELQQALELRKIQVFAALPDNGIAPYEVDLRSRSAIVIGSEARGVSEGFKASATPLRIPTSGVESLNAAVAAGILLYEGRRQRMLLA